MWATCRPETRSVDLPHKSRGTSPKNKERNAIEEKWEVPRPRVSRLLLLLLADLLLEPDGWNIAQLGGWSTGGRGTVTRPHKTFFSYFSLFKKKMKNLRARAGPSFPLRFNFFISQRFQLEFIVRLPYCPLLAYHYS